ncbi:CBS domain-containing protein [Amphritea sp. 1_MG-2023]|uniref:CBS domain-containing protein n=1 Tax=Amphritea sp. 1_MG-2023 TaxID=3062670 RepID=UPI0026E3E2AD|nr:CBS domain-containing protein [Amphritea sp. 1_MG-2023]MDO6564006.1 CBS domain-containing protein [Amphritea sp. 1_MG-2023]
MALVIYDQGYRIQTPVKSLFTPRGVEQLGASKKTAAAAGDQDHEKAMVDQTQHQDSPPSTSGTAHKAAIVYSQTSDSSATPTRPRSYIPASLIMSSPIQSVLEGSKIQSALYKMQQYSISHLLVLSGTGRLMGIVTEKLLLQYLSYQGAQEHSVEDSIERCYTQQVITATPDTNIRQLAVSCVEHHLSCIPVVEENGNLQGIITRTDLLQSLINNEWLDSR